MERGEAQGVVGEGAIGQAACPSRVGYKRRSSDVRVFVWTRRRNRSIVASHDAAEISRDDTARRLLVSAARDTRDVDQ